MPFERYFLLIKIIKRFLFYIREEGTIFRNGSVFPCFKRVRRFCKYGGTIVQLSYTSGFIHAILTGDFI